MKYSKKELTDVFDKKHNMFMSFCKKYRITYHDSEDVIQDLFIKLYINIEKYDIKVSLTGFVYHALKNKIIDRIRKNNIEHKIIPMSYTCSTEDVGKAYTAFNLDKILYGAWSDVELLKKEKSDKYAKIEMVKNALAGFNEKQIEVYQLRIDGMKIKHIAQKLGIKEDSARQIVSRIQRQLKNTLNAPIA